jgi:hypothetical protein
LHLSVAGTAGIPAQGASAVVMNLTATEPDRPGWVAAYPCDQPAPATSNLNYAAGQTIPNLVTVPVAADGSVCLITLSPTHVVADTFGWYGSTGTGFNAVGPVRLVDTRAGVGVTAGKLAAATQLKVKVAGAGGLPASGVSAATFNVTVTEPDRAGFLTAFACGSPPPATSNLNFVAGQTIANLVTVPHGSDGSVCFSTVAPSSAVQVVVDLFGWYGSTGAGFNGVAPRRLLDTRIGLGAAKAKLQPGTPIKLQVAGGSSGLSAGGVSAVTLNLTATEPDRAGWLAAYPCDQPLPGTSNVNYLANQTIPNSVTVPVAEDGTVCIATLSPTHVVADLFGWFSNS